MTIEECYTAMGANYQDVLRRFYKPDMIRRFARMFLQDTSFQQLTDAMARQDFADFVESTIIQPSGNFPAEKSSFQKLCCADREETQPVRNMDTIRLFII